MWSVSSSLLLRGLWRHLKHISVQQQTGVRVGGLRWRADVNVGEASVKRCRNIGGGVGVNDGKLGEPVQCRHVWG